MHGVCMRECSRRHSDGCDNPRMLTWLRDRLARRRVVHGEGFGIGWPADATPVERKEYIRRGLRRHAEGKGESVDEAKVEAEAQRLDPGIGGPLGR